MKSCCGGKNTQVLWCEHWGGCQNERRVGVTKFHFPIILGLVIMSWFCSGQPNIRCVFHSPVFFLVSQPVDRIQTLERKLKALEDERAHRSTEEALITLLRHLNRPLMDTKQSSCWNLWFVSPGTRRMRRLIRTWRLSMKLRRGRTYWIKNRYRGCSWAFWGILFGRR